MKIKMDRYHGCSVVEPFEGGKKAADKRIDTHFFNMEKMNALYGKDWYEDYQSNKRDYAYADDTKEAKKESGFSICARSFYQIIKRISQMRWSACYI